MASIHLLDQSLRIPFFHLDRCRKSARGFPGVFLPGRIRRLATRKHSSAGRNPPIQRHALTPPTVLSRVGAHSGEKMPVRKVQIGQVWKKSDTGDNYLVTQIQSEALATFAVMRKTGAESEARVRAKIVRGADSQTVDGFVFAQESDDF